MSLPQPFHVSHHAVSKGGVTGHDEPSFWGELPGMESPDPSSFQTLPAAFRVNGEPPCLSRTTRFNRPTAAAVALAPSETHCASPSPFG